MLRSDCIFIFALHYYIAINIGNKCRQIIFIFIALGYTSNNKILVEKMANLRKMFGVYVIMDDTNYTVIYHITSL